MIRHQTHHVIRVSTLVLLLLLSNTVSSQVVERLLPSNAFAGLTPGPDGRLYGVTYEGGTSDKGTLYSVDTALTSVVIHVNFGGATNGAVPYDELIWHQPSGKFYGTATDEGPLDVGTIFSYVPGASSVTVLRSDFGIGTSGFPRHYPHGLVIVNSFIYGLALGFTDDVVFRMNLDGSGFLVLQDVGGTRPQFLTAGTDGRIYGETLYGGSGCPTRPNGCGSIFRLRAVLPGDTDIQFQEIHDFKYYLATPCPPGDRYCVPSRPFAYNHPLRLIWGSDGLLYGNTFYGIFRLDPSAPNPSSTIQFIWTLGGGISLSIIEGSDGKLYAADYGGGANGVGEVFSINRDGTGFSSLRTFSLTSGLTAYGPYGRLYRSPSGAIYGTTEYTQKPSPFPGTVFSIGATPTAPASKMKVAGGNVLVGSPGEGLILRSPAGSTCVKIGIDNSGALTNVIVACP